jgi:hypothetical protein
VASHLKPPNWSGRLSARSEADAQPDRARSAVMDWWPLTTNDVRKLLQQPQVLLLVLGISINLLPKSDRIELVAPMILPARPTPYRMSVARKFAPIHPRAGAYYCLSLPVLDGGIAPPLCQESTSGCYCSTGSGLILRAGGVGDITRQTAAGRFGLNTGHLKCSMTLPYV